MKLTGATVAAVALALAGCSGSGSGPQRSAVDGRDQTFLTMATQDQRLATEDHGTLISLGHEACDLLDQYQGDARQVDSVFVATGGKDGAAFFTPAVMQNLRAAAASAYCPKYR